MLKGYWKQLQKQDSKITLWSFDLDTFYFLRDFVVSILLTKYLVSLRKDRHYVVVWSGNQWQRMDAKCQFGPKKLESVLHSRNITVLKCKQTGIYAIAKVIFVIFHISIFCYFQLVDKMVLVARNFCHNFFPNVFIAFNL